MTTIERATRDVQSAIEVVRSFGESERVEALPRVERELWVALLALGCAVISQYLARRAARPRGATYLHEGTWYAIDPRMRRSSVIGTRFGKVTFCRPVGTPIGTRGRADLPVD